MEVVYFIGAFYPARGAYLWKRELAFSRAGGDQIVHDR